MSKLVSDVDYGKFFDNVMNLDSNIRLVAVYDGRFKAKLRNGTRRNFEDEEIKSSMIEAQNRWIFRKKMGFKTVEPKFAMAQYDKTNRITIPLDDDGVILLTTELDVDINELTDKVIETRIRFLD
jgi:hypothetical protein